MSPSPELLEAMLFARRQAERACRQLRDLLRKLKAPMARKPTKVWYK